MCTEASYSIMQMPEQLSRPVTPRANSLSNVST